MPVKQGEGFLESCCHPGSVWRPEQRSWPSGPDWGLFDNQRQSEGAGGLVVVQYPNCHRFFCIWECSVSLIKYHFSIVWPAAGHAPLLCPGGVCRGSGVGFPRSFPTNGDTAAGDEHSIHLYILDVVKGTGLYLYLNEILYFINLSYRSYAWLYVSSTILDHHQVSVHQPFCTDPFNRLTLCS